MGSERILQLITVSPGWWAVKFSDKSIPEVCPVIAWAHIDGILGADSVVPVIVKDRGLQFGYRHEGWELQGPNAKQPGLSELVTDKATPTTAA